MHMAYYGTKLKTMHIQLNQVQGFQSFLTNVIGYFNVMYAMYIWYIRIYKYKYIYVYMYVRVCVCACVCLYVCMYARIIANHILYAFILQIFNVMQPLHLTLLGS